MQARASPWLFSWVFSIYFLPIQKNCWPTFCSVFNAQLAFGMLPLSKSNLQGGVWCAPLKVEYSVLLCPVSLLLFFPLFQHGQLPTKVFATQNRNNECSFLIRNFFLNQLAELLTSCSKCFQDHSKDFRLFFVYSIQCCCCSSSKTFFDFEPWGQTVSWFCYS